MNTFTLSLLLLQQHESDVLPPGLDVSEKHIPVVSRKRAHGRYTLLCTQTGGWVDICNITAFYHPKKHPFLHYHNLQQDIAYQHTHPPSTSLIQFSVCTSQAWGYYKHWTWDPRTQGPKDPRIEDPRIRGPEDWGPEDPRIRDPRTREPEDPRIEDPRTRGSGT